MESAEPQPLKWPAEDGADARPHLARSLVGKGHRQYLAGIGPPGNEDVRKTGGQHPGLAGAGTSQHQQWSVDGDHCLELLGIQAVKMIDHATVAMLRS